MNPLIKTLASCAFLGASGGAFAAPVLFSNGSFNVPDGANWYFEGINGYTIDYQPTGGSSLLVGTPAGGFAQINGVSATQPSFAVLVASNNTYIPLSSLGMTAGNGYTFSQDMKILAGASIGGLKLEYQGGPGGGTDEKFPTTIVGNGSEWATYNFDFIIPAGVTGVKVVPLWAKNSTVGIDNVRFESVPYFVAPTPPPPPPEPTDVVHQNAFAVASPNWGTPTGTAPATVTFSGDKGNPPGSTVLNVAGTGGVGDNFFTYIATGIEFGDGPVEISFDVKREGDLIATAVHTSYNGNPVFNIENQINGTTFTTIKRKFNLNQGFLSNTLTLQFQFAMGPVVGNGGTIVIDNIVVKTNLPGSAPPTTASIESGKLVDWDAANPDNSYQPQESATNSLNNADWTNLGAPITNPAISSAFDSTPSAFYRVRETSPAILDNKVFNPGFEFTANANEQSPADGWNIIKEDNGTVSVAQSYPGGYLPNSGSNMLVLEARTPSGTSGPAGAEIRASRIQVNGGETFNFSFNVANVIKSGVSGDPQYVIRFYDGFGGAVGEPAIGSFLDKGEEWTKVVGVPVMVPVGTTELEIAFAIPTGPFPDLVYVSLIDDISLDTGVVVTPSQTTTIASTASPAVKVSWKTVTGRDYQVKSSTTLQGWDNFGASVAGDGSIFSVTDLITPPRKFYRVEETTP